MCVAGRIKGSSVIGNLVEIGVIEKQASRAPSQISLELELKSQKSSWLLVPFFLKIPRQNDLRNLFSHPALEPQSVKPIPGSMLSAHMLCCCLQICQNAQMPALLLLMVLCLGFAFLVLSIESALSDHSRLHILSCAASLAHS